MDRRVMDTTVDPGNHASLEATEKTVSTTAWPTTSTVASSSCLDHMAFEAIAAVFISIFLIAIVGNSIVIYILFRKRRSWNVTTTYLFNLAIADAIFVCTLPLWAQAYLNRLDWKFGMAACKMVGVITSVNMYASIFFLTAMSVDRWIAVVHATTINTVRNSVMARSVCICVWLGSFLLAIPRLLYQTVKRYKIMGDKSSESEYSNVTELPTTDNTTYDSTMSPQYETRPVCVFFLPPTEQKEFLMGLFEFSEVVIGFIIPMVIICICYFRIVRTVKKKLISKRVKKERVAMLAAMVVTAFFICWLPRQILILYSSIGGWWNAFEFNPCWYRSVSPFFICLAWGNSCVNPFLYAFTATNFKNNVREVCGSKAGGFHNTGTYKMKLAGSTDRSPYSPKGKSIVKGKGLMNTLKKKCNDSKKENKQAVPPAVPRNGNPQIKQEFVDCIDDQYSDVFEHPQLNPELQHLAIDETTSGVYYEYYSSPAVLGGAPRISQHRKIARADIVNHNKAEETSENHHEWCPTRENQETPNEIE